MSIPETVKRFLDEELVGYEILGHPRADTPVEAARAAYVPPSALAHAVALRDRRGVLVAVFPADRPLDVPGLSAELDRDLRPLERSEYGDYFPETDWPLVPALAKPYGLKAVVDTALPDTLYLRTSSSELIRMRKRDLIRVQNAWNSSRVSGASRPAGQQEGIVTPRDQMRERIQEVGNLPAMPTIAHRILQLRANPYADVRDLVDIVELDPSVAAQILRYARSPFFGYRGQVDTIQDAVSRVLGYEMAMNVALAMTAGASFNNPKEGPLGLRGFWRHAVYCGSLTQLLAKASPQPLRPKPGLAYLAGMLHNFGILLLGHLFKPEFYWLNKAVENDPQAPLTATENELLGISHTDLGGWLFEHWNLPEEITVAARQHHTASYDGIHATFSHLVLIANRLLKRASIGDAETTVLPADLLAALQLTEHQAEQLLASVIDGADVLDGIARQMAA